MNELEAITIAESKELIACEKVIEEGLSCALKAEDALRTVRDKRLYRSEFASFEDYCQTRWGKTRQWANYLLAAGAALKSLPPKLVTAVTSVKAAAALSKVPPPKRAAVVSSITKAGQAVTAKTIRKVSPPPPKPAKGIAKQPQAALKDETGLPIPPEAIALWHRGDEVQELLTFISALRGKLRKYQDGKDILFFGFSFSETLAHLDQAYVEIKRMKPYAVCPTCNGKVSEQCNACNGRGLVSEFYWTTCVPEELKALRTKAV